MAEAEQANKQMLAQHNVGWTPVVADVAVLPMGNVVLGGVEVQGMEARAARVLQMRPGSTREDVSIEEARLAAIIGKGGMEYKRLVATSGCEIIIDSKGWLPSTPVGPVLCETIG